MSQENKIRLDKWLWACRFFKTRALAKSAIESGKVHFQGTKPKPGKIIQIGYYFKIRQGFDEKIVQVIALSDKRGSATTAQALYKETQDSLNKREEAAKMRKLAGISSTSRPDKKQRRMIHRFKNKHDYNSEEK